MDKDLPNNFLERLKRHTIFRIAAIYAVAAWILIQLSSSVLPNMGLPKDSVRFVIIVVGLGFPVMLILAWTFVKPTSIEPEGYTRWKHWRVRLGSLLSIIIIVLVGTSGWYLWRAAVIAHVAKAISETAPVKTASVFNPLPNSIAVLPFRNQSNDHGQQYFSDGFTEEITSALGALPDMHVISWQSASMYRGKQVSANAVGKALNVANILTGSIRRDGDRVRISAELVNAVTGYQLWSAHYDRTFKDIFSVQDEISKAMANALQLHLPDDHPLVSTATANADAHDFYLRGLADAVTSTAASLNLAIGNYQQAIRLDPKYAEAYAGLAQAYAASHLYTNIPLTKSLPLAKRAARQALRLNPKLAAAHKVMGMVYALEQKPRRAMKELHHAIELDPNNAVARIIYATLLPSSKYKEAQDQYRIAVSLDPNNAFAHYNLGVNYETHGDYKNAMTEYQATLGLAPQLVFARFDLANLYHRNGDDNSAVAILTGVTSDDPFQTQLLNAARLIYMAQENQELGTQALAALKQIDENKASATDKAVLVDLYILAGQNDHALQLLSEVCANAPETCADIAIDPSYTALHDKPAFQELVKKYKLKI
ncbi:MAG: tetratricopeptide repeat protein [Gammaproteobacteria bacterium]